MRLCAARREPRAARLAIRARAGAARRRAHECARPARRARPATWTPWPKKLATAPPERAGKGAWRSAPDALHSALRAVAAAARLLSCCRAARPPRALVARPTRLGHIHAAKGHF